MFQCYTNTNHFERNTTWLSWISTFKVLRRLGFWIGWGTRMRLLTKMTVWKKERKTNASNISLQDLNGFFPWSYLVSISAPALDTMNCPRLVWPRRRHSLPSWQRGSLQQGWPLQARRLKEGRRHGYLSRSTESWYLSKAWRRICIALSDLLLNDIFIHVIVWWKY